MNTLWQLVNSTDGSCFPLRLELKISDKEENIKKILEKLDLRPKRRKRKETISEMLLMLKQNFNLTTKFKLIWNLRNKRPLTILQRYQKVKNHQLKKSLSFQNLILNSGIKTLMTRILQSTFPKKLKKTLITIVISILKLRRAKKNDYDCYKRN